jgi:hypothetical protein
MTCTPNHYAQAIDLVAALDDAEHRGDEPAADAIRDTMDHVWLLLATEERDLLRAFSVALYDLEERPKTALEWEQENLAAMGR